MKSYGSICLYGLLFILCIVNDCDAKNQQGIVSGKIYCFIDNTIFMSSEENGLKGQFFKQTLIPHLIAFAKLRKYDVEFFPIGSHESVVKATTINEFSKYFLFQNQYTKLNLSLLKCGEFDEKLRFETTKTIVIIISQFKPGNISGAYENISYNDYVDLQETAKRLKKWQKNSLDLHLIHIVNEMVQTEADMIASIEENMQKNIQALTPDRKKYITESQKDQLINAWIHAQTDRSEPNLSIIHRYQVEKRKIIDLLAITDGIIDPNSIKTFHISLIVDSHLFGSSKKCIERFAGNLKKILDRKGPRIICNNPLRKTKFSIMHGKQKHPPKNNNENDAYRYYINQGILKQHADLIMMQQDVFCNKTHQNEYFERPGHSRYQIFYQSDSDLISHILVALQKLRDYQKTDFKITEQYKTLRINTPKKHLLKGYNVCKKGESCDKIDIHTIPSAGIDKNGEFTLLVNMQGKTEFCLVAQPDDNEPRRQHLKGWKIGEIDEKMLYHAGFDQPIDISNVSLPSIPVLFKVKNLCLKTQKTPILYVKLNDPVLANNPIDQSVCQIEDAISMIPGMYYYHIIFPDPDYNARGGCLSQFFIPLTVTDVSQNVIEVPLFCQPDALTNYETACYFFEHWKTYKKQKRISHIKGSPNFYYYLLKYTSEKFNPQKQFIPEQLTNIWKEVYKILIESKLSVTGEFSDKSGPILNEAFKKLGIVKTLYNYKCFKRILNKICNYRYDSFSGDILDSYKEVLRIMEPPFLSKDFIEFLKS